MKKNQRSLLSILLVLALLATLPMTVMAEDFFTPEGTISTGDEYENNYAQEVTNNGTVTNNGPYYTHNPTIKDNNGTVVNNNGPDNDPDSNDIYGGIVENNNKDGEVTNNNAGAVVENNNNGGTVVNNHAGGEVTYNAPGGKVENNSGTVGVEPVGELTEDNEVPAETDPTGNSGTVVTNNIDGVVYNNVGNEANGVGTNYGTVHQKQADGTYITYYGLQKVDNDSGKTSLENVQAGADQQAEVDLRKYSRSGYELAEYKLYQGGSGTDYDSNTEKTTVIDKSQESTYKIKISMPSKLELFWKKIASVFKPASTASSGNGGGGAEAVELSARKRYIGLGSVIFINEKGYKVVELKDDAFVVVSFDALSDEDVKDLDALFAKLFTAEQQKQIKNVGQLLDAEDVLTVFGKPGNHPVYEVNKALVE